MFPLESDKKQKVDLTLPRRNTLLSQFAARAPARYHPTSHFYNDRLQVTLEFRAWLTST